MVAAQIIAAYHGIFYDLVRKENYYINQMGKKILFTKEAIEGWIIEQLHMSGNRANVGELRMNFLRKMNGLWKWTSYN